MTSSMQAGSTESECVYQLVITCEHFHAKVSVTSITLTKCHMAYFCYVGLKDFKTFEHFFEKCVHSTVEVT